MNEIGISALVSALICAVLMAVILWIQSAQCHSRWEGSGMKTEWKVIGGCKVQRKDGTWVPASAIRDLAP